MSDSDNTDQPDMPTPDPKSNGCPRWLRITLFFSVALNLLVVGAIAGAVMRNDGRHGRPADIGSQLDPSVRPFAQALTGPQRRAVGEALSLNAPKLQAGSKAVRAQLEDMLQVLRAEDFSADAFGQSIQVAQARLNDRQNLAFTALISQIAQMSDEERLTFADRLERSFKRKPPRRK